MSLTDGTETEITEKEEERDPATDPGIQAQMGMINTDDPNWSAAVAIHANNTKLSKMQRAQAEINTYRRLTEKMSMTGVDNPSELVLDASLYDKVFSRETRNLIYTVLGPVMGFITSQAHIGSQFAYEVALDRMYRPRRGEKGYAVDMTGLSAPGDPDGTGGKLNMASAAIKSEFPGAAHTHNHDGDAAPGHDMKAKV